MVALSAQHKEFWLYPTGRRALRPASDAELDRGLDRERPREPGQLAVGRILSEHREEVVVEIRGRCVPARRARSLLLAPRVGDKVLVWTASPVFVLSVLEREDAATEVEVEGALHLRGSRCVVSGRDAVEVDTEELRCSAERMSVRGAAGEVVLDRLNYVGRHLHAHLERIRTTAADWEQAVGRMRQRFTRSEKHVSETETVRAGSMDIAAETGIHTRARYHLMNAVALFKVRGEQVHLG